MCSIFVKLIGVSSLKQVIAKACNGKSISAVFDASASIGPGGRPLTFAWGTTSASSRLKTALKIATDK